MISLDTTHLQVGWSGRKGWETCHWLWKHQVRYEWRQRQTTNSETLKTPSDDFQDQKCIYATQRQGANEYISCNTIILLRTSSFPMIKPMYVCSVCTHDKAPVSTQCVHLLINSSYLCLSLTKFEHVKCYNWSTHGHMYNCIWPFGVISLDFSQTIKFWCLRVCMTMELINLYKVFRKIARSLHPQMYL